MDKEAQREPLYRYWQKHIQVWAHSGQSQAAYCQSNDLKPHQFSYWKRKIQGKATTRPKPSAFIPVQHHGIPASGLSLVLPNGLIIQGIDQQNLSIVEQLVRQL